MGKRVVAIQIDLEILNNAKYEALLGEIEALINGKEEFNCRGIGYTEDITKQYEQYDA